MYQFLWPNDPVWRHRILSKLGQAWEHAHESDVSKLWDILFVCWAALTYWFNWTFRPRHRPNAKWSHDKHGPRKTLNCFTYVSCDLACVVLHNKTTQQRADKINNFLYILYLRNHGVFIFQIVYHVPRLDIRPWYLQPISTKPPTWTRMYKLISDNALQNSIWGDRIIRTQKLGSFH